MSNYRKENSQRFAEMFNALSNPNRLRIFMDHIQYCSPEEWGSSMENARSYMKQYADELGIAPSTVSHHLKELRQAGLIQMARRGRQVACWVEKDVLEELSTFFNLDKKE